MERTIYKHCQICKSQNISPKTTVTDHTVSNESYTLFVCLDCGFLFTQNHPTEEFIGDYYKSKDYVSHSDTKKGVFFKTYQFVRKIMLNKKFRLLKNSSSGNKILDIGCGTGYFLNYMKSKGYKVLGIEKDDYSRKYGEKKFDITIKEPKTLFNQEFDETFDIITLWHVLEHLQDLDKYITKIRQSLKDDGLLVLALPNHDCFDAKYYKEMWAGYDVPIHLWHFTPQSILKLAEKHKLKLEKIKRLPFDSFYVSILSEKAKKNSAALIFGFIIGFASYFASLFNVKKSSSVVYLLKKK